ncbi:cell division cycle 20 homolog [Plasmopara halstedii]|uniref:Cell division cycle 20 homolog n=1 Tax=Plasmopara halstedii TaxID=4781 RepID=A0A0P1AJH7_PLAHL|nr:cell division cycle 20 homolog [Plasmopara halstedii]CEG40978.1 cell division cycle 20 homolog [Plasmopara halstedii]|eukprot:XP_024577347.1 cell division cycle 20 homolog [Plasmopara halstedii]
MILDAPNLRNDFYLNLMDWSSNGLLAIALDQKVHLYTFQTGDIETLDICTNSNDYVTSVQWAQEVPSDNKTCLLAIGTFFSEVQLWNVTTLTKLQSIQFQCQRISSLAWNQHHLLASGCQNASIQFTDFRCAQSLVQQVHCNPGEICGLKWSQDGDILASGSHNHELCLYDHKMIRSNEFSLPIMRNQEHQGPIRALAWSPYNRYTLISGDGTLNGTLKLWRTSNGTLLHSVPTNAQVCAIAWSSTSHQVISAHGHGQMSNQLVISNDSTLQQIEQLQSHTARVLNVGISPDGTTVASCSADETLRFWKVFPLKRVSKQYLEFHLSVIR